VEEGWLLVEITGFIAAVRAYYKSINAKSKRKEVERILALSDWCEHYKDKQTGRRVLSERDQKRFDVYLLRDTIILEADLKCIFSKNPDTIGNRIVSGSDQASREVLDIRSDLQLNDLIDGLRSGTGKNKLIKEILLFYKNGLYILPKNLIWSKRIFDILKSEKGYT
jgi:hypothetical protein